MKTTVEVEIKPFIVPNFVVQVGEGEQPFSLSLLSPDTLDKMCNEFRDAVFKKAGKAQPPTQKPCDGSCRKDSQ